MDLRFAICDLRLGRAVRNACANPESQIQNPQSSCGFTLLELVLVLLVLSLLMALATPSLRGWSRGAKLKDETDRFLAATRWARSQAIATAQVHRISIDSRDGSYWITVLADEGFVSPGGEMGRTFRLPGEIGIEALRSDGGEAGIIDFYPNGRVTPARVRLVADWGETVTLEAATPAEPFRLATARR